MSAKYTTVDAVKSTRGPGTRDSDTLTTMFVTPTLLTSYIADAATYKNIALGLLLDDPTITENIQVGSFSRDYSDAPSYAVIAKNIAAGAVLGAPASPWVPNPSSPGPDRGVDPINRPAAPTDGMYSSTPVIVPNASNATSVITPARDPSKSSINMAKRVATMQPPGQSPATINSSG